MPPSAMSSTLATADERPVALQRSIPVGGLWKRMFDIVFAATALLVLAPLLLLIAVLVKASDGKSVLFAHRRVGFDGQMFPCLKFRTMAVNSAELLAELLKNDPVAAAEWAKDQKLRRDPRVSPIGRLLRVTSLDELPQLFNVLKGEMSIVGPRPVTNEELVRYGASADVYRRARPGLTGLWQISGRNSTTYAQRVEHDVTYVERCSPAGDLVIIARTVRVVLTGYGAC